MGWVASLLSSCCATSSPRSSCSARFRRSSVLAKVDALTSSLKSLSPFLQIEMAQQHVSFFDSHGHGHVGGVVEATVGDSHQRPPWWATTTTQCSRSSPTPSSPITDFFSSSPTTSVPSMYDVYALISACSQLVQHLFYLDRL